MPERHSSYCSNSAARAHRPHEFDETDASLNGKRTAFRRGGGDGGDLKLTLKSVYVKSQSQWIDRSITQPVTDRIDESMNQ